MQFNSNQQRALTNGQMLSSVHSLTHSAHGAHGGGSLEIYREQKKTETEFQSLFINFHFIFFVALSTTIAAAAAAVDFSMVPLHHPH